MFCLFSCPSTTDRAWISYGGNVSWWRCSRCSCLRGAPYGPWFPSGWPWGLCWAYAWPPWQVQAPWQVQTWQVREAQAWQAWGKVQEVEVIVCVLSAEPDSGKKLSYISDDDLNIFPMFKHGNFGHSAVWLFPMTTRTSFSLASGWIIELLRLYLAYFTLCTL